MALLHHITLPSEIQCLAVSCSLATRRTTLTGKAKPRKFPIMDRKDGVAFASVEKHREICSAVLPPSTMEESRDGLTAFGAASGIHSQDPDHSSSPRRSEREGERAGSSLSNSPR
ncbi:unnamed protein product [Pleuronectes platessa]|uniref:Uncharacterized protein n=1 Tax=Pleuronectes platessa TaxID=8262 RepID=A0A9N7ZAS1_PLEPL|nr:unnamed protein product [Pleuronectes platessa]